MHRLFSILTIVAISSICLPAESARSQDADPSCKSCQEKKTSVARTIEFELPGIDFPIGARLQFQHDEKSKDSTKPRNQIEISCECELGKFPFLANVPYIRRLLDEKEKSIDSRGKSCEQNSQCSAGKSECPAIVVTKTNVVTKTKKTDCPACHSNHPVRLQVARFGKVRDTGTIGRERSEMFDEILDLSIENQRLHAKLEAAEHQFEMMREMFEVREENAALRARLEFFEQHTQQVTQRHLQHPVHPVKHGKRIE